MEFKGIDWTEVAEHFGIVDTSYEGGNDAEILEKTNKFLNSILFTNREAEVGSALRTFIGKLYENSKGVKANAPIWKGLLEVEDDFTLIKYSIILLEHMWY